MPSATRTSLALAGLLLLPPLAACAPATARPADGPSTSADTDAAAPKPPPTEGTHFVVYTGEGWPSSLDAVVEAMAEHDAVLVGEEHDDRVTHQVQRMLLERAFTDHGTAGRAVILSLEMFERDVQYIVDEYLEGLVTESHFRASARPWENYEPDYRPLVEFAREHDLPVVAANAPRRYVNRVSRLGRESLDDLSKAARSFLPPLPYPEPTEAYRAQWNALMGEAAQHGSGSPLDGQALWDAAMGHSVARALDRTPAALVLHMAGGFHVERNTGIPDAVRHYRPWTRLLTVAARPAEDPGAFDPVRHRALGDFVILTSETATDPPER